MKQKEFVVASPQQQEVIASFTTSPTKRHLVLEGPAGTGKTLMAVRVTNDLLESMSQTSEEGKGPVLIVTAFARILRPRLLLLPVVQSRLTFHNA